MRCHLKKIRTAKGVPQTTLASQAGLTRQALGAIESGRYVPNTAVALTLARLLGCRVEDLFSDDAELASTAITLIQNATGGAGTRVAVASIRQRLIGFPLDGGCALDEGFAPGDGVLDDPGQVRLHVAPERMERTALLLGCDPAFPLLGAAVARSGAAAHLSCRFASSSAALDALGRGEAHLAGTHLHCLDQEDGDLSPAHAALAATGGTVATFAAWEQGLMVAPGNPKGLRSVADLADPRVMIVNRDQGSGSRRLLDDLLARAGIPDSAVRGYHQTARSHLDAARRIAAGLADAAIGLRAVAAANHLDFVPLRAVRCDLAIPADLRDHPAVIAVLDVLSSRALRADLAALPGYDTTHTGTVIATVPSPN
jgi:molybdate-binding protein/DNA-binding XRE family transcriptional regulator